MRYLSVCSGIEAATVAWHGLGWTPVAFSEIEPFPSAVLAHHYPHVPNVGDMTNFKEWNLGSVDLLVGGTPCQSFSVAGLRKGLDDPRGNLMLTFLAIAERHRPRWIVWENVPGVLSSNGGRDFGTFLGALGELGYGWAYRVLDAQWFGVAQRRRRVFVVGCLGDWQRPAQVLFERESVRRDSPPSREKGQEVAGTFKARVNSGGWCQDVDLAAGGYMRPTTARMASFGEYVDDGTASTIKTRDYKDATDLVAQPITFGAQMSEPQTDVDLVQTLQAKNPMAVAFSAKDYGADASEIAPTLRAMGHSGSHANGGGQIAVVQPVPVGTDCYNGAITGNVAATIGTPGSSVNASGPTVMQPVAFQERGRADGRSLEIGGDVSYALTAPSGGGRAQERNILTPAMQVRRLTPVECERLQGFPDNYTNIPWRKKPESPDGPRYKALGNSMAVPCMRWIGERIQSVSSRDEKLQT